LRIKPKLHHMKRSEIEFWFEGPEAATDAQALSDFLKSSCPEWQARIVKPPKTRHGEFVQWVVVISAIIAAVKNAADLADRLRGWATKYRAQHQRNPFVILWPNSEPVPLDQAKPEDLAVGIGRQLPEAAKDPS